MTSAPNNSVEVDGQLFTFPDDWDVFKYDDSRIYRDKLNGLGQVLGEAVPDGSVRGSSKGLTGCDLLAIDHDDLWLIEVKDYSYSDAHLPSSLARVFAKKVCDTLAGIQLGAHLDSPHGEVQFFKKAAACKKIYCALNVTMQNGVQRKRRASMPSGVNLLDETKRVMNKVRSQHCKLLVVVDDLNRKHAQWSWEWTAERRTRQFGGS